MVCTACERLLNSFELAVDHYYKFVHRLSGVSGFICTLTFTETQKLRYACLDAKEELKAHWRGQHSPGYAGVTTATRIA